MSNKEEHYGVNEQDTIAYSYPHPRKGAVELIIVPNSKFIELNTARLRKLRERELLQLGREEE